MVAGAHAGSRGVAERTPVYRPGGPGLLECLQLRVKDVDFGRREIVVRRAKGGRGWRTVLPRVVERPLAGHLARVRRQHEDGLSRGGGWVELPDALARKYPNAEREWGWQ